MLKAVVCVTLKPDVLDPQGRAIQRACATLGWDGVADVRQGKYFEIQLQTTDRAAAERMARELCEKLLANPVIEDWRIERIEG
ncbi:MAG: phosphoribosylformylglycinamidine synthase [Proteobacteria bacterium]|nr:MAG: phosphoribosylformylglycinamidine synthase [Pseudomonadota bacterium]